MRLQPHALPYKRANILRCIELPEAMAGWSLTSLQLKPIKMGARVIRHARAITFQLSEMAVTGAIVPAILATIRRCERLRHSRNRDPRPNRTKAPRQVCPPR